MYQAPLPDTGSQICPVTDVQSAPSNEVPRSLIALLPEPFSSLIAHSLPQLLGSGESFKYKCDQRELARLVRELQLEARRLDSLIAALSDPARAPVTREGARTELATVPGSVRGRVVTEFSLVERAVGDGLGMHMAKLGHTSEALPAAVRDPEAVKVGEAIASLHDSLRIEAKRLLKLFDERSRWEKIQGQRLTRWADLDPDALLQGLPNGLREPFRQIVCNSSYSALRQALSQFRESPQFREEASRMALRYAVLSGQHEAWPALIAAHAAAPTELFSFVQDFSACPDIPIGRRKIVGNVCFEQSAAFFLAPNECPALFGVTAAHDRYLAARSWLADAARWKSLEPNALDALVALVHSHNEEADVAALRSIAEQEPRFAAVAQAQRAFWIAHGEHFSSAWIPGNRLFWKVVGAAARLF